jgi:GGDEF domain-containing protein
MRLRRVRPIALACCIAAGLLPAAALAQAAAAPAGGGHCQELRPDEQRRGDYAEAYRRALACLEADRLAGQLAPAQAPSQGSAEAQPIAAAEGSPVWAAELAALLAAGLIAGTVLLLGLRLRKIRQAERGQAPAPPREPPRRVVLLLALKHEAELDQQLGARCTDDLVQALGRALRPVVRRADRIEHRGPRRIVLVLQHCKSLDRMVERLKRCTQGLRVKGLPAPVSTGLRMAYAQVQPGEHDDAAALARAEQSLGQRMRNAGAEAVPLGQA